MSVIASQTRFTPEDLLRLEGEGLYELVDGKLVEKQMSSLASKTAGVIVGQLFGFLRQSGGGEVFPENSFQCFGEEAARIRRPDVAVIVASRLSQVPDNGHCPIPPDIAIEVVSDNDTIYELDEKLADYRSANIPLIWVVDPKARTIRVRRLGEPTIELEENATLTADPVLPGFSILVRDLLPPATRT